ncbi:MAG: hypothetical protein WC807_19240 [Hyphomicrobium sp.]|jgi:hypothetical protein
MKAASVALAAIAVTMLMGGALDPEGSADGADEQQAVGNPVPPIVVTVPNEAVPAAPVPQATPPAAAGKKPVNADAAKAATPAKGAPAPEKEEVLPWAGAAPAPGAPAIAAAPSANEAKCQPLFEAACRDTPVCAWVADAPKGDGSVAIAHCAGRVAAPAKKVQATKPKQKPAEATPANPKPIAAPGAAVTSPATKPKAAIAPEGAKTTTAAGPADKVEPPAPAAKPVAAATAEKKAETSSETPALAAPVGGIILSGPGQEQAVTVTIPKQ